MVKVLLTIILVLILMSCNTKTSIDIKVINKSEFDIDSVFITNGIDTLKFKNIQLEAIEKGYLKFESTNFSNDGINTVKIYSKGKLRLKNFDYFSNGIPSVYSRSIIVKNNNIVVN